MAPQAVPAYGTWQGPETVQDRSDGNSEGPGWGPEPGPWKQQGRPGPSQPQWRQEQWSRFAGRGVPCLRLKPWGLKYLDWPLQGPQAQRMPSFGWSVLWLERLGRPAAAGAGGSLVRRPAAGVGEPRGPGQPCGLGPPAAASPEAARTQSWAWDGGRTEPVGAPVEWTRPGRCAAPHSFCS